MQENHASHEETKKINALFYGKETHKTSIQFYQEISEYDEYIPRYALFDFSADPVINKKLQLHPEVYFFDNYDGKGKSYLAIGFGYKECLKSEYLKAYYDEHVQYLYKHTALNVFFLQLDLIYKKRKPEVSKYFKYLYRSIFHCLKKGSLSSRSANDLILECILPLAIKFCNDETIFQDEVNDLLKKLQSKVGTEPFPRPVITALGAVIASLVGIGIGVAICLLTSGLATPIVGAVLANVIISGFIGGMVGGGIGAGIGFYKSEASHHHFDNKNLGIGSNYNDLIKHIVAPNN